MDIKTEVKKIQNILGITEDGILGDETVKAIAKVLNCDPNFVIIQKILRVQADGVLGPKTIQALLNTLQSDKKDKTIKIALLPGHSSKDGGAKMVAGLKLSEYDFAMKFIPQVKEKLEAAGYEVVITSRELAGGTTPLYSAKAANAVKADAAFEFHFNSAGKTATGSEYLYKAGNELYRRAADAMCTTWSDATGLKNRGSVAVCNASETSKYSRATSRGVNAFTRANMFFCMTEPFFSSNPGECEKVTELFNSGKWASYMVNTIIAACDTLFD